MNELVIVAHINAKPKHAELIKTALEKLINTTRTEPGCIQYDLHQDHQQQAHFMFYERWQSRELWQQHMQTEHLQGFMQTAEKYVESISIHEMHAIG